MCNRIEEISAGRFKITPYAEGEIASGFDPAYCVRDGVVDMLYQGAYPMYGVVGPAALLAGTSGYPAGATPRDYQAWWYYGDGLEMANKVYDGWGEVIGGWCMTTELFCHSNVRIETADDLKGLKFRTFGLWAEILETFGASVVTLPGGEIYQAAERGVIDAFEYCPPATNWPMGFHEITKYVGVPGIHSPAQPILYIANYDSWAKLPDDLKMLLKAEIQKGAMDIYMLLSYEDAVAMQKYADYGTEIVTVSDELQQEIARRSREWTDNQAAEDPLFKEIYDNLQPFINTVHEQERVVPGYSIFD